MRTQNRIQYMPSKNLQMCTEIIQARLKHTDTSDRTSNNQDQIAIFGFI